MDLTALARDLGLSDSELEPYGRSFAKVSLDALARREGKRGRLLLVTAMTPTPLGEGKTTCAIGLVQGLKRIGVRALATLRQPTLGPVFGLKGGATGGGRSRLEPHERIDLHLTGDSHAVQTAHNLAAAFVDNHLHQGNALGIDPARVLLPRVLDLSDRALRRVVVGLGSGNGPTREAEFVITSASEVMAILALAKDLADLRERLSRIVVARRRDGSLVTTADLGCAGAMAALLRDAVLPNLVATTEGAAALVHAGPFGNVAHGCSSVVADRLGLALADVTCTEAGFASDLGAEKFFDLKCRASGLWPDAAVLVATVRALKHHGGVGDGTARAAEVLAREDVDAVHRGAANLAKHVENVRAFGVPVLVCVNAFATDSAAELEAALAVARAAGAAGVVARPFDGGEGCEALARATMHLLEGTSRGTPRFLYADDAPLARKLEAVARSYGAASVELAPAAARDLASFDSRLGVCVAKTPLSLSDDPGRRGRPEGFPLRIREVRLHAGAGFVTCVAGDLQLMPGLPARPAGERIDLDATGAIAGLR